MKLTKNTIEKIDETKGWFFEKINKIDRTLARLVKKKREDPNKMRNEEVVTTDTIVIQRLIRDYYKKLYANKWDILEKE